MSSHLARLVCALLLLAPFEVAAATVHGPLARLRVEGRVDQNLIDGQADGAGMVQPLVGWRLQSPTSEIEATYAADVIGFADGGLDRGGVHHRLRGRQEFHLDRRTVFQLHEGFERVYDPTGLTRAGVVRSAGRSNYGFGQIDLQHRLDPLWTGGLRYRGEIATLEAPGAIDGAVHAPGAWLHRALGRRDSVGVSWRSQFFDAFQGADATSHEPTLLWMHLFDRTTRLELEAGPAWLVEAGAQTVVPTGRAMLVHRRPRLEIAGWVGRSLIGSTGYEGALWAETAGASGEWRVAEPLSLTLALGVFRNGRAPEEDAFVEGFAGEVGAAWLLADGLAAEAAWRRVAQVDVVGGQAVDLSRNIFLVGMAWTFQGSRLPR